MRVCMREREYEGVVCVMVYDVENGMCELGSNVSF